MYGKSINPLLSLGFIAKNETGNAVAWMPQKAERYVLRAVDEAGRADSREVNVEFVP